MDCPNCGEPDMLYYPGEWDEESDYQEPDAYECPDCGNMEVL